MAITAYASFTIADSNIPGEIGNWGRAKLTYDRSDPYAVTASFGHRGDGSDATWVIARSLLAKGLAEDAGRGDVRCRVTHDDWYLITLNSPYGYATIRFAADDIRGFLIDAEDLIPYTAEELDLDATGDQVLDFDAELDAILKDGAR